MEKKLSTIMKEMAQVILRHPSKVPSSAAGHAALLLTNVAWNESIAGGSKRLGYEGALREFEKDNPDLWDELMPGTPEELIDRLTTYKASHYASDRRQVHVCGFTPEGKVHVEWTRPTE